MAPKPNAVFPDVSMELYGAGPQHSTVLLPLLLTLGQLTKQILYLKSSYF